MIGHKVEAALPDADIDLESDAAAADAWLRRHFPAPAEIRAQLVDELCGLGPLKALLADPNIGDIHVNGPTQIWVERGGTLQRCGSAFLLPSGLERVVKRLLFPLGRKVDRKNPVADGRLPDGSRFCVVVPPAAVSGTHLSIRKFRREVHSLEVLRDTGMLSAKAHQILCEGVSLRKNILVSGATGSGKTTLLNALAERIAPDERIITIEDTAELQLNHVHVVALEGRPPNSEGEGAISLRSLLKASLRMRPDRIIVGECRGFEALDLLQSFNTGHGGCMATIHANSTREALQRLEILALLGAGNLEGASVRGFIQAAVQVLVHVERRQGRRYVSSIQELRGQEAGVFLLKEYGV